MIEVDFACPSCQQASRSQVQADQGLKCPACGYEPKILAEGSRIERCLACGSHDLFVRKDFPQRLGVAIVVVGIVLSSIAWGYGRPILTYAILFASALIDLALYLTMRDALMCYRCGAMHRGADLAEHGAFDLETHERYRQQAARLAEARRGKS